MLDERLLLRRQSAGSTPAFTKRYESPSCMMMKHDVKSVAAKARQKVTSDQSGIEVGSPR